MIRVMLVDDQDMIQKGFSTIVKTILGVELVGQAFTGREALHLAEQLLPDVIVMDLGLPDMSGVEVIRRISKRFPSISMIAYTGLGDGQLSNEATQAGATVYMSKDTLAEDYANFIFAAAKGITMIDRDGTKAIQRRTRLGEPLTRRELDVLEGLVSGKGDEQIAQALHIEASTVKTHVHRIFGKLGVENRTQAAVEALRNGYVT